MEPVSPRIVFVIAWPGSQITVSIGVATFREHGNTPESIIASADAALYQAKRRGRNRVVRASAKREEKAKQRA